MHWTHQASTAVHSFCSELMYSFVFKAIGSIDGPMSSGLALDPLVYINIM